MRQAAHGGLDAGHDDGHVGVELFQYSRVYVCRPIGAESCLSAGGVGVVVTQTACGCVVVHHTVHSAGGDAEEKSGGAELAEVAQVVAPVGLRDDGHFVPRRLQRPPDDSSAERGVVDVGIARYEHNVDLLPPEALDLVQRYRQKMRHIISRLLQDIRGCSCGRGCTRWRSCACANRCSPPRP